MSNTSVKVAFASFVVLAMLAASFARRRRPAATGYLEADRPNAAGLSALDSMSVDPSGMGNASR
jgi:hypothetical protein